MRPPRKALASIGSTARGSFRTRRQWSIEPDREAAERQRGEGRDRQDPRRRAQSHVERDAVDDDMRDVDDHGHRRHAEAGEDADDDRDDD